MTVVVSDTSPIRALEFVDHLDVLPILFGSVLLPPAVAAELARAGGRFRSIDVSQYAYLQTQPTNDKDEVNHLMSVLDRGEAEAIVLACEVAAHAILIDEAGGRQIARQQFGLRVTGTLGILLAAKDRGLVLAVRPLVDQLRDGLGFFVSESLYQEILRLASEVG